MSVMITFDPAKFNPIQELVDAFISANSEPFNGTAKRDQLAHEARIKGVQQGIAQGMATYINGERIRYYSKLASVEQCSIFETLSFLNDCLTFWKEATEKYEEATHPNMAPTAESAAEAHNERQQALEVYVRDEWTKLIRTHQMDKFELERHREAVAAGTEEMTDEDRDWIKAQASKAQEEAERLAKLAADLGV